MTLSARLQKVGAAPTAGGQHDAAAGGDVGGLDHGPVHRAQEAVARHLRHQRQVHVEEARLPGVDAVAQVRIGLVRSAEADGFGLRQRAIERRTRGGAGEDADLKFTAGLVLGDGAFGQGERNRFGRASRGEPAETNGLAVLDHGGCFGRGEEWK